MLVVTGVGVVVLVVGGVLLVVAGIGRVWVVAWVGAVVLVVAGICGVVLMVAVVCRGCWWWRGLQGGAGGSIVKWVSGVIGIYVMPVLAGVECVVLVR